MALTGAGWSKWPSEANHKVPTRSRSLEVCIKWDIYLIFSWSLFSRSASICASSLDFHVLTG